MSKTLRLILGDQLNINHSWFEKTDNSITYVIMEIRSETDYATHHIQKIVGFFSAMRNFAAELKQKNHQVFYYQLNDESNLQAFDKNIQQLIDTENFTNFEYQFPDELRLDELLKNYCQSIFISTSVVDSEHFMSSRSQLGDFFEGKKNAVHGSCFVPRFVGKNYTKHDCLFKSTGGERGRYVANIRQLGRYIKPRAIP